MLLKCSLAKCEKHGKSEVGYKMQNAQAHQSTSSSLTRKAWAGISACISLMSVVTCVTGMFQTLAGGTTLLNGEQSFL